MKRHGATGAAEIHVATCDEVVHDMRSARFKYIIYIIKYVHMTVTTIYPSSWGAHDPKKKRNEK